MLLFEFNVILLTSIESLTPPPILNPLPTLLNDALCVSKADCDVGSLAAPHPILK